MPGAELHETCRDGAPDPFVKDPQFSTDKVKVEVVLAGVGAITQTDVKMASAGEAVILGEGFAIVGEDFTAMHPGWSERAPLILHAFFWNRQILACALMLVWLALPLLADGRRLAAAAT